jgi:hypothetical protein
MTQALYAHMNNKTIKKHFYYSVMYTQFSVSIILLSFLVYLDSSFLSTCLRLIQGSTFCFLYPKVKRQISHGSQKEKMQVLYQKKGFSFLFPVTRLVQINLFSISTLCYNSNVSTNFKFTCL